mmetsp:Transcript_29172/g.85136  ORF Transcript_29172/g.85136 Transcript_29172/m.85136 type:complete len:336 (+) Transcript_29172:859-1866(+)
MRNGTGGACLGWSRPSPRGQPLRRSRATELLLSTTWSRRRSYRCWRSASLGFWTRFAGSGTLTGEQQLPPCRAPPRPWAPQGLTAGWREPLLLTPPTRMAPMVSRMTRRPSRTFRETGLATSTPAATSAPGGAAPTAPSWQTRREGGVWRWGSLTGAGPKEFWQNINPKKNDTFRGKGTPSAEKLEAHMWRLVLLVRCQDRKKGLRLARHESQRKLLDMRIYELLLLYMRQELVEEELIRESEDGRHLIFAPIAGEDFLRHLGKNKDPTLSSLNFRPFQALSASVKAMGSAPKLASSTGFTSTRSRKTRGGGGSGTLRGYSKGVGPAISQLRKTG